MPPLADTLAMISEVGRLVAPTEQGDGLLAGCNLDSSLKRFTLGNYSDTGHLRAIGSLSRPCRHPCERSFECPAPKAEQSP